MSTFDIQSIAPEGYEVVNVEDHSGVAISAPSHELISFEAKVTIRKKWTPKVGEIIAVRATGSNNWEFRIFQRLAVDGAAVCATPASREGHHWAQHRKLTQEERGE